MLSEFETGEESVPTDSCLRFNKSKSFKYLLDYSRWMCSTDLVWLHYMDDISNQEIWTYYLTPGYSLEDVMSWAGCIEDQQQEFTAKNYSQHQVGVWSLVKMEAGQRLFYVPSRECSVLGPKLVTTVIGLLQQNKTQDLDEIYEGQCRVFEEEFQLREQELFRTTEADRTSEEDITSAPSMVTTQQSEPSTKTTLTSQTTKVSITSTTALTSSEVRTCSECNTEAKTETSRTTLTHNEYIAITISTTKTNEDDGVSSLEPSEKLTEDPLPPLIIILIVTSISTSFLATVFCLCCICQSRK